MPKFDVKQAIAQLKALGYQDDETVYFRALKDKSNGGGGINFQAPASQLPIEKIESLQAQEYGIYFVVNGGGNSDKDVKKCRAIFYEHDNLDKDISAKLWRDLGLPEPTFQIDTGGKSIHTYWVLNEPITPEQWRVLQADLLEFADADRSLKNPSRVMRLAGAYHQATGRQSTIILNIDKDWGHE